ncbi:unnamed protein product [Closterium sp. Naga37s-1]|nr:unnamed protein product [Closterium sp. Naga37s-1]
MRFISITGDRRLTRSVRAAAAAAEGMDGEAQLSAEEAQVLRVIQDILKIHVVLRIEDQREAERRRQMGIENGAGYPHPFPSPLPSSTPTCPCGLQWCKYPLDPSPSLPSPPFFLVNMLIPLRVPLPLPPRVRGSADHLVCEDRVLADRMVLHELWGRGRRGSGRRGKVTSTNKKWVFSRMFSVSLLPNPSLQPLSHTPLLDRSPIILSHNPHLPVSPTPLPHLSPPQFPLHPSPPPFSFCPTAPPFSPTPLPHPSLPAPLPHPSLPTPLPHPSLPTPLPHPSLPIALPPFSPYPSPSLLSPSLSPTSLTPRPAPARRQ